MSLLRQKSALFRRFQQKKKSRIRVQKLRQREQGCDKPLGYPRLHHLRALGIVAIAVPLIIFTIISPRFVRFEPLRKYKKTMEAKKAGIAYSDNLAVSEIDNEFSGFDTGNKFTVNTDIFNQIKAERTTAREQAERNDISSTSAQAEKPMVHVIDDVSEQHSVDEAPLKKLHSEGSRVNRHYITLPTDESAEVPEVFEEAEDDVKEYRPDGNKYSANRRF